MWMLNKMAAITIRHKSGQETQVQQDGRTAVFAEVEGGEWDGLMAGWID